MGKRVGHRAQVALIESQNSPQVNHRVHLVSVLSVIKTV
jgi:hypothetical protein